MSADSDAAPRPRRGLDYDDPIDAVPLQGPLTRETARRLADDGVTGVKLDESIPAAAFVHLAEAPTVVRVDLSHRRDLVDGDLAFLAAMPWLTAVSLARCASIGDAGVAHLRTHQALEQINLQWSGAGDEAAAVLAGKPALHRVLLGSRLTDAGVAHLRDFPALRGPVSDDSFVAVSSSALLTDNGLEHLGELAGVVSLDVHYSIFGSRQYTARGVAYLRNMTALEELNFLGELTTDAVLREIARMPRLRKLLCQDMVAGDEGFVALGECATLEEIWGRACHRVGNRGFAALGRLPRLRSLAAGGRGVGDAAMAALVDAPALADLMPVHFGDAAFASIARMPRLQRLTNMYNRATTDGATRHLRDHPRLVAYGAFGTQITDESLRILAGIPTLELMEIENCRGITDAGVRELARLPRLRRLSVRACLQVTGDWTSAIRQDVETRSGPGERGEIEGYRFETLMDYPDMPIPPDAATPHGQVERRDLLSEVVCVGCRGEHTDEGLRLSVDPPADTRWVGALTREAFSVPLRIEMVVKPARELHVYFGRLLGTIPYLPGMFFGDDGLPLLGRHYAGTSHAASGDVAHADAANADAASPDAPNPNAANTDALSAERWTRITIDVDEHECRLLVDDVLRHGWRGDFAGQRNRVAVGPRNAAITVRELTVEAPTAARTAQTMAGAADSA